MFRLPVSQKVILSYEWRNSSCIGSVSSGTRANHYPTSPSFIPCCCECPNMFPWIVPMCNADTIYVHTVNGSLPIIVIGLEGICGMVLICSDSATDFLILHPINWEGGSHTACSWSPTCSLWGSYQSEPLWAVLVGVSHVEVGHPHLPPSVCYHSTPWSCHSTPESHTQSWYFGSNTTLRDYLVLSTYMRGPGSGSFHLETEGVWTCVLLAGSAGLSAGLVNCQTGLVGLSAGSVY